MGRVGLTETGVQRLDALDDLGHLVDGVLALLGRRTVSRDAVRPNADLSLALMAERDEVAARLADDGKVGLKARIAVEELEVHAVAVLLADGAGHVDRLALEKTVITRGSRGIDACAQAALHIHGATAPQLAVDDLAAKGVVLPILGVVDLRRIHVSVKVDDLGAAADTAHGVAGLIDIGLVIAELFHLGHDEFGHRAFLVGIAAGPHRALQKINQALAHGSSLLLADSPAPKTAGAARTQRGQNAFRARNKRRAGPAVLMYMRILICRSVLYTYLADLFSFVALLSP